MKVWTGAVVKLSDGELAQVTETHGTLVKVRTSAGIVREVQEASVDPASFDEISRFRQADQPPSAKQLVGQKRLELD
jgi:hypothetical protein